MKHDFRYIHKSVMLDLGRENEKKIFSFLNVFFAIIPPQKEEESKSLHFSQWKPPPC